MTMSIPDIAVWLESTAVASLVRETVWGFPIVVAMHIVGITLSVGMIMWFDLRLLGVVLRDTPVSRVYRGVIPWAATGFALMFVSGGMLLAAYATAAHTCRNKLSRVRRSSRCSRQKTSMRRPSTYSMTR